MLRWFIFCSKDNKFILKFLPNIMIGEIKKMNRKHTYRKAYTKDVKIIYGILAGVLVAVILFAIGLGIFTAKRYVIPVMFPSPTITSSQTPTITSTSTITPTVTITLTPSSTPEPTWHIETIDQNGSVGGFSSLVVDRSGEVHIVYFDDHHDRLKYVHGHFSDWSYPDSLDGEWMGLFPLIALDNNQKPHVVHYSRAGQLRYGYLMQSRWKFTAIQDAKISGKISLVFDEHDNPHILYLYLLKNLG
jgi:hypothetical protein